VRWAALLCLLSAATAHAHPVGFGMLRLEERGGGEWELALSLGGSSPALAEVTPALPEACEATTPLTLRRTPTGIDRRQRLRCAALRGELGLDGLPPDLQVQLRVEPDDEAGAVGMLSAREPRFDLGAHGGAVFGEYVRLGVLHILEGIDHLLFVLGLVVLLHGRWRALGWTVTAFTAGHSVTLSLASLGWVSVSSRAAEAVIALSILLLAVELARGDRSRSDAPSVTRRAPWAVAALFGLVHGLGFAGALAEVGLPRAETPLALFGFNLGVELGQLVFVAALLLVAALGKRSIPERLQPALAAALPYVLGIPSSYWLFERIQ